MDTDKKKEPLKPRRIKSQVPEPEPEMKKVGKGRVKSEDGKYYNAFNYPDEPLPVMNMDANGPSAILEMEAQRRDEMMRQINERIRNDYNQQDTVAERVVDALTSGQRGALTRQFMPQRAVENEYLLYLNPGTMEQMMEMPYGMRLIIQNPTGGTYRVRVRLLFEEV